MILIIIIITTTIIVTTLIFLFILILLFILIWQGGGNQADTALMDVVHSLLITLAFFVARIVMDAVFPPGSAEKKRNLQFDGFPKAL
jgi:formate hydrogenlyase subunit 4